jgi:HPt (histidine-containing phosphotransfer) domain-containing protein
MKESRILDIDTALQRIGDDKELYQEVLKIFLEDAPLQLQILNQSIEKKDFQAICDIAHSLKSATSSVGAERMKEIASQIEQAAIKKDFSFCVEQSKKLFEEFETMKSQLEILGLKK